MVICAIPNYRMVFEAASPLSLSNANICCKLKGVLVEINLQVVLYFLKHVPKLLLSPPNPASENDRKDSDNKNFLWTQLIKEGICPFK